MLITQLRLHGLNGPLSVLSQREPNPHEPQSDSEVASPTGNRLSYRYFFYTQNDFLVEQFNTIKYNVLNMELDWRLTTSSEHGGKSNICASNTDKAEKCRFAPERNRLYPIKLDERIIRTSFR